MALSLNKFLKTLFITISSFTIGFAQTELNETLIRETENTFQGHPIVTLNNKKTITIEVNSKGVFDIKTTSLKENLILSDAGSQFNTHNIYTNYFNENLSIKAYSNTLKNNKISKTKAKISEPISDSENNIFHDDGKKVEVLFLGLEKGSLSVVENVQRIKDPRFLSKFYFSGSTPSKSSEFVVVLPNNVELFYNLYGAKSDKIKYTKTEKGKFITHKWSLDEPLIFNLQKSSLPPNYVIPHVTVRIGKVLNNEKSSDVLSDVSSLYSMYREFVNDVNAFRNPELKTFVDSITAGLHDEEDIVRTIYTWVQNNIKYVAFEAGMDGFIPDQGIDVYRKRYGDCKGMSSVLNAMLNEKGIKSYLTWVGTDILPYNYQDEPSPVVDNHMVLTYKNKEGKNIILDATNNLKPFGVIPSSIQGKQVLIGIDSNQYELYTLGELNADENAIIDSINLKINNQSIEGKGAIHAYGYFSEYFGGNYLTLNQLDQKDFVKGYTLKGNNKYILNDFELVDEIEQNHEIRLNYTFTLDDYIKVLNNDIIINPHLNKILKEELIEQEELLYHFKPFKNTVILYTSIQIPEGFTIGILPENFIIKRDEYEIYLTYKQEKNILIIEEKVIYNFRFLPESKFEEWNKDVKNVIRNYNKNIKLTRQ